MKVTHTLLSKLSSVQIYDDAGCEGMEEGKIGGNTGDEQRYNESHNDKPRDPCDDEPTSMQTYVRSTWSTGTFDGLCRWSRSIHTYSPRASLQDTLQVLRYVSILSDESSYVQREARFGSMKSLLGSNWS